MGSVKDFKLSVSKDPEGKRGGVGRLGFLRSVLRRGRSFQGRVGPGEVLLGTYLQDETHGPSRGSLSSLQTTHVSRDCHCPQHPSTCEGTVVSPKSFLWKGCIDGRGKVVRQEITGVSVCLTRPECPQFTYSEGSV